MKSKFRFDLKDSSFLPIYLTLSHLSGMKILFYFLN